jgi:serine/threonine protein kinase
LSEPERPATDLAGTVLEGVYRLVALRGQGGMGAVYEAVQLRLDKRVAVKLMARELASNREALARFHREAEITSHLGHPHLVNVVDFGTAESGAPYLVMEYLEGEDLEHRLQRVGRLSLEAAVYITKQTASALGAAHARDVVHRDLKPANIFLMQVPGEPEFVKVLDFGISKMKAARARLTRATAVVGTPHYMSPEQAAGRVDETDHRADQWALACIVWEMLAGRTPFAADDVTPLFYQITNLEPEPLTKQAPHVPAAVDTVLRRALAKRPADRFAGIREFSRAFEEAALGRPADATPTPVTLSRTGEANATSTGPTLPMAALAAGREPGKKMTTFSHTTGEVTQTVLRRRLRPGYLIALATSLVVVGVGVMFVRTTDSSPPVVPSRPAPSRPLAPSQSAPSPTIVVPLPEPALAPPPSLAPAPTTPTHPPKAKSSARDRRAASAEVAPKRKLRKVKAKRRIFQEL